MTRAQRAGSPGGDLDTPGAYFPQAKPARRLPKGGYMTGLFPRGTGGLLGRGLRPLDFIYPNYYTAMQEQRQAHPRAAEKRDREEAYAAWLRDHPGPRLAEGRRYGRE